MRHMYMQISVKWRQEAWVFKIIFGKFEARLNISDPISRNNNKIPQSTFLLSFHKYYTRVNQLHTGNATTFKANIYGAYGKANHILFVFINNEILGKFFKFSLP